jgi:hypothetical protein
MIEKKPGEKSLATVPLSTEGFVLNSSRFGLN